MTRTQQTAVAAGVAAVGAALLSRGLRYSRRIDFDGRTVVITGGSRGLGLVLARELGQQGARLVIGARDEEELDRACRDLQSEGIDALTVVCDVGEKADAERLIAEAFEQTGRLDVLVNNAGVIRVGPVEHMALADFEEAMAVHFWGPLYTTLAAMPLMRDAGGGRIVNISSIGGRIGVPHLVPYCASKFALCGFSQAMRGELAKDGIHVTTVCPGLMRTGSPFNAWFKGQHRDEFAWFVISDSLPLTSVDARRAAAQIADACRHADAELVVGIPAKLAIIANALVPEAFALAMDAAGRLLPGPIDDSGNRAHSGWQSFSERVPPALTKLTDRAAVENNELDARALVPE
jgi:NAD(P)-dependent dehydrogenase (short-subunit alcohol dehydrogenase family)